MGRVADLTGQRFARLTVLAPAGRGKFNLAMWECRCDCGSKRTLSTSALRSGNTKSCGCLQKETVAAMKFKDLTGKRFGRLVVQSRGDSNRHGQIRWVCKCDCGSIKPVIAGNLMRHKRPTQSCGCLIEEAAARNNSAKRKPPGHRAYNCKYGMYRGSARKRGIEFKLTLAEFSSLISRPCSYCGKPPHDWNPYVDSGGKIKQRLAPETIQQAWIKITGVDREDPDSGYVLGNCRSCCTRCNQQKLDRTLEQWILEDMVPIIEHAGYEIVRKKEQP